MGKVQNLQNSQGLFFLGDDVKIGNLNTAGNQTITNYFGDVDQSRGKNNGDGTYSISYRLKFGEPDLEDWKEQAQELERKVERLEQQVANPADDKLGDLLVRIFKLIGNAIAKRFGF